MKITEQLPYPPKTDVAKTIDAIATKARLTYPNAKVTCTQIQGSSTWRIGFEIGGAPFTAMASNSTLRCTVTVEMDLDRKHFLWAPLVKGMLKKEWASALKGSP